MRENTPKLKSERSFTRIMPDIRKVLLIFVISVLFAGFVFSLINAVYPHPTMDDYCVNDPSPPPLKEDCPFNRTLQEQRQACLAAGSLPREHYDDQGCVASISCDDCQQRYDEAQEHYTLIYFLITALLGASSILGALLLPEKNQLHEWIGSGFLLGGVIVIFGGTIMTFGHLYAWLRPIVMLGELILVISLAYRLWGREKS